MDKVNYQYKRWTMQRKQELMYNTQMKIKSDKKSNKTKRAQSNRRCCPKRSKSVFKSEFFLSVFSHRTDYVKTV